MKNNFFANKTIKVCSGPVIIENDGVFLNKEGNDPFWKFPGGKVKEVDFKDISNSLENACKREVDEENLIKVEIICPLKPLFIPRKDKENELLVLIHYFAKRLGEIKLGAGVSKFAKFNIYKMVKGEYENEEFADNILLVVKDYIRLKDSGILLI